MQSNRLQNEAYRNWLKVTLSLDYVKQALTDHVTRESQTLHVRLQGIINRLQEDRGFPPLLPCTLCSNRSVKRSSKEKNAAHWRIECATCNTWLEQILREHVEWPTCAHIPWENIDPKLWPCEPWEVAKVFQRKGCRNQRQAEDGDVSSVVGLIENCKSLRQGFNDPQNLSHVRNIRNQVMHSRSLEVSHQDMMEWTNTMICLLEDPHTVAKLPLCQEAVAKIKELQINRLEVNLDVDTESRLVQELQEVTKDDLDKINSLVLDLKAEVNNKMASMQKAMGAMKIRIDEVVENQESAGRRMSKLSEDCNLTSRRCSNIGLQVQENELIIRQCVSDVEKLKHSQWGKAVEKVDLCQRNIETERLEIEEYRKLLDEQTRILEDSGQLTRQHMEALKQIGEKFASVGNYKENDSILQRRSIDVTQYVEEIKDLRDKLISIYTSKCLQINIFPHAPEVKKDIDDVYVNPNIEFVYPKLERNQDETHESLFRPILFNGARECKNIYITGEAGVGKSVFCENLVNVWCKAHTKHPEEEQTDDEQILSKFPLLFYISLKFAAGESSIEEMIDCQLVKCDRMSDVLEYVNCLIIIDGLDEWDRVLTRRKRFCNNGVPDRPLCIQSTIITTTRPWKFENLRLQKNEFDKHVKITGISAEGSKELANALIKMLKETHPREVTYEEFEKELRYADLERFQSIPLNLQQLLCLWYGKIPFGYSKCDIYSNIIELQFKFAEMKQSSDCDKTKVCEKSLKTKLPKCFKQKKLCQKYSFAVTEVSKFAFNTLFSDPCTSTNLASLLQEEVSGLSEEQTQLFLSSGILTKTRVDDMFTQSRQRMTFVHKTYQEFFAAIFLASRSTEQNIDQVLRTCCSVGRILEIQDLYRFVFGMNAEVGSSLVQKILQVISDDDNVLSSRKLCSTVLIQNIQNAVMNILEEADNSGNQIVQLQLEDLRVDSRNVSRTSRLLDRIKTNRLKSLTMNTMQSSYEQNVEYRRIFKQSSKSKSLEKLVLTDNRRFVEIKLIKKIAKNSQNTLKLLRLEYISLEKLSDPVLDLLLLASLESLSLRFVYLTHKQIKGLMSFPRTQQSGGISEIYVEAIRCVSHGPLENCSYKVDLSHHRVRKLALSDIDVDDIQMDTRLLETVELGHLGVYGTLGKTMKCLESADKLLHLQCNWCKEPKDVEQLIRTLRLLCNLRTLELSRADIQNMPLKLSPHMTHLELIELKSVTISLAALTDFVNSLPRTPHRLDIRMENMNITDENGIEDFVQYIQTSKEPRFTVLKSDDCINFYTVE